MTAPNTTNNVTVRKLVNVAEGMWNKSKNAFVNASGDTMTGRLTLENAPINQFITGTGTVASASGGTYYPAKWTFDIGISTPNPGDQIIIKSPCAGHSYGVFVSTDNGMNYFPVADGVGSGRLTTRFGKDSYIPLVFESHETGDSDYCGVVSDIYPLTGGTARTKLYVGCWRVLTDYDSGNYYERLHHSNTRFYAGSTGCYPYSLVFLDNTGRYSMLVTSNPGPSTTNKTINSSGKFVYPAVSMYYNANNTANAGALVSSAQVFTAYPSVDIRYSCNYVAANFTTHKAVYLECTLNGDGTWSPTATLYTQTPVVGKYYIYMGIFYSDKPYITLDPAHPLYYYDGTNLVSAEVARGDITSGTNNGELNVAGTDITVYTHPTDAGNKHIPAGGSSGQFLGYDSDGTAKWVSNPNTDTKVKATAKTDNVNYKILATASASPSSGAATEAVYDTDITLNPSTNTIAANVSGTAASAGKLTTARTTYVTLGTASTSTTRDWSGTTTIPVSGTLGLGNGGTGATSAAGARTNLDVYSKSETESLLNGKVVIVTVLPATGEAGKTYYVKDTSATGVDKYDEYIWAVDAGASTESWIHVGEKSLDLSEYVNSLTTSGTGPLVKSLSKSGNALTATLGTIAIDNLSDWASSTDVTVSSVTYHTWWPVAPTSSNQVYGLAINGGKLYQVYNNKGTYSVRAYDKDSTYTNLSLGQGYGTCATGASTAAKIVTMSDYALTTGGIVTVKFTNALCASATMNINGKGAKPIYIKGAAVAANNAATVSAGDTAYFMYDGTAYHLLGTDRAATNPIVNISRSGTTFTATRLDGTTFTFTQQDNNTTYTQAKLGQGYGTCTTAEATAAKSVTLTGYELEPNGVVAVKFTNGLCASATMSINGKTATPIYINGAAVTSTSCKEVLAGDLAFFIYDGSHYQFICTDRISKNGITGLSISGRTITYTRADGTTGTLTTQDTTYTFDGVYNSSSNKAATVSTVTNAVNALDVDDITGFGAGKTLATLTETDGKIAATFQNISITKSQVSDFSHSHGNITNDGKVGTTADYAVVTTTGGAVTATSLATSSPSTSGNTLEFIDTVSQNSKGKISATKKKVTIDDTYSSTGTNPVSGKAIAAAIETLDVTEVGGDGKYIKKIKEDNGKITATVETMDTTPTANSTKAVTSGGIKTALDVKADDSNVVHKTGNETVGGTKTFSDETVFSTVHRDTRYASNLCNYFESNKYPTNVVVWTKCRWASGVVMPIIRIYGNTYNPYGGAWELKISYYVYNDALGHTGVVSIGNYKPGVYLWKYTDSSDNKDYVAVGLTTDPAYTPTQWYFRGFQVDVQLPASGYDWYYVNRTGWSTSSNGADTTQVIIPEEGTSGCVKASYLSLSTDISGNAATASAAQTGSALETAIDSKANIANSVYYVVGSHSYASWTANTTYALNDNVVYSNRVYYCKTAHTSTSSFDSSKWTYLATVTLKGTADGITTISTGLKIAYKMPAIYGGNTSTYLNINNLGSYYIKRNNGNMSTHIPPNAAAFFVFDGTAWQWADYDSNTNNWVTTMGAYCDTAAATAAKVATSTNTVLTAGMSFLIRIVNSNTSAGKLTLNINSQGAKDVWINGAVSSASNYTLPAGEHWCHYDGSVFHIWTDGTAQFKNVAAKSYKGLEYTDGENLAYQIFKAGSPNTAKSSDSKSITITPEDRDTHFSVKLTEAVATTDIIAVSMDVEYTGSDDGNWYWPFNFIGQVAGGCPIVFRGSGHYAFSGTAGTAVSADEYAMFDDTNRVASRLPANSFTIRKIKIERGATPTGFRLCKKEQTPPSHTHGNISNTGTLTDTAAAAAGNDYVVIRDADNAKIQTSTIKGTDVSDAVSKKHSHSTLTLSTTAQAYDGSHTLALPSTDPYTSARTPASHASTATTYGIGTTSNYGHVKLATGDMNGATNTDGVAVSKNHTHSQYAPKASPALTGTPTAPTAADGTNTTQIATTAFVQSAVAQGLSVSDAMVYKGTITLGATSPGGLTVAADKGHTYKVVANGNTKEGYVDGVKVEAGDMVICNTDSTAAATSSNYSTIAAKWDFVQGNTDGVVVGPSSATSGNVVVFDGATGKLVKDGGKLGTAAFKDVASSGNASTTQVVMGNDSRLTDSRTPASHTHGNITNTGTITSDTTVASGDKLVIVDADNNKIARSGLGFDTAVSDTFLCRNGNFATVKEADVRWGGSFRQELSPIEFGNMCRNVIHNPPPAAIKFEKTTDGGTTWTEQTVTDNAKMQLCNLTLGSNFSIANSEYASISSPNMLKARITLTAMENFAVTSYSNTWFYAQCKRIVVYCSRSGNSQLKIETQSGPNFIAHNDTWTDRGTYAIAGDSGWNSIPFDMIVGGYSGQLSDRPVAIRFTYWIESGSTPRISISRIGIIPQIHWTARAGNIPFLGVPISIENNGEGTIARASRLATACKLAVSLSNTSTDTSFNGSADVTNIKVSGQLADANIASAATWNAKQDAITYMTVEQENSIISELGEL